MSRIHHSEHHWGSNGDNGDSSADSGGSRNSSGTTGGNGDGWSRSWGQGERGGWRHHRGRDGNGGLGAAVSTELQALTAAADFGKVDKNGDGTVTRAELRTLANNSGATAAERSLARHLLENNGPGRTLFKQLTGPDKSTFTIDDVKRVAAASTTALADAQIDAGLQALANAGAFDEGDGNQDGKLGRGELRRLSADPEVSADVQALASYLISQRTGASALLGQLTGAGNSTFTLADVQRVVSARAAGTTGTTGTTTTTA